MGSVHGGDTRRVILNVRFTGDLRDKERDRVERYALVVMYCSARRWRR